MTIYTYISDMISTFMMQVRYICGRMPVEDISIFSKRWKHLDGEEVYRIIDETYTYNPLISEGDKWVKSYTYVPVNNKHNVRYNRPIYSFNIRFVETTDDDQR
jgi:hypothetical protein